MNALMLCLNDNNGHVDRHIDEFDGVPGFGVVQNFLG